MVGVGLGLEFCADWEEASQSGVLCECDSGSGRMSMLWQGQMVWWDHVAMFTNIRSPDEDSLT